MAVAELPATFHCADCGMDKPVLKNGETGYGEYDDGKIVCYQCCAERDRAQMDKTGRIVLYITRNTTMQTYHVGNWPGTLEFPARKTFAPYGRTRNDWYEFRDHRGRKWLGWNGPDSGQILRARLA